MSDFHCPLGIRAYLGDGCIDCGLCIAKDMKAAEIASQKMEAYIRSTNIEKDIRPIRKICVTGKGGVGKSTISSILARIFAEKGNKVLVLDTDESNPSLYKKLGFQKQPKSLISCLERFNLEYGIPDNTWLSQDEIRLSDIPDEFIVEENGIMLMETGKICNPFQGCACSMADLSRQLMKNLVLDDGEIVIADLEAGVESFGRGIEQGADTILAVTETSLDSMTLAEQIGRMSNGIGIRRVYTIFNRVPDDSFSYMIDEVTGRSCTEKLGKIDYASDIMLSGFRGEPVPRESAMFESINDMVNSIMV